MCFSAEASFAAGDTLAPAAVYCPRAAWVKNPRLLPVALVPAAFAAQQVAEGVVWLGLHDGDAGQVRAGARVYLFFALAFWPFLLPLLNAILERRPARERAFAALTVASLGWFWALYYPLLTEPESYLTVRAVRHSILYSYTDLAVYRYVPRPVLRVLYVLFTVGPLLTGPNVLGRLPGLIVAASVLVAAALFDHAFISVWCFFAAGLSLYLCVAFYRMTATAPTPQPA
ncbi:MAG: DUF6629 family protein [Gemmata sp.]